MRFALALAYLAAACLYAWQASRRASPTIFSDEIEFTEVSRSIAETGVPSRRGEPYGFQTLYTYLIAPAWWIDDTESAWEAAKLIGVLVMSSALFPAYLLARFVVSRPWAAAAAAASVAAPPLAYAPYLMEEPLAYPVATLGLWAVAAVLARPTWRRLAVAGVICAVAPFVRGELGVLALVLAVGLASLAWRSERARSWRSTWTAGDWLGLAVLAIGAAVAVSAAAGHRSDAWYVATGFFKHRVLDHATWSLAALAIGLAILPLLALVAAILSPRLRADEEGRAFAVVAGAALVCFVGYAGVKGAYLSTVYGTVIVERNLIYLVPLALAATAAILSRAVVGALGIAAGFALALYLVLQAELRLDQYPYFEAPSLAIGALANRNWAYDPIDVRNALLAVTVVSLLVVVARMLVRARAAAALAIVALVLVSGWALTTEIYAARGLNRFADRLHDATPQPLDWVDRATGGEPTLYLGQRIIDKNPIWLLEFWNRSIDFIWSLDGSAPTPTISPDLAALDGSLSPDPGVDWVVTGNGVEVVGQRVGEPHGDATLFRIDPPLRVRYAVNGISPDGWMSSHASYSQYAPDDGVEQGFARVVLSRQGACSAKVPTSVATVRIGDVVVGPDKQPALGTVTQTERRELEPCSRQTVVLRAVVPFHVDVTVSPTFVPAELDPASGDERELGAQVGFDFLPLG